MYQIGKANAFVAAALAAMGVSVSAAKPPVIETMLNSYTVSKMYIAQVGGAGKCMAVVTVNSGENGAAENRFVAERSGAIKLYADFGAMASIIRLCKVEPTTTFELKREPPAEVLVAPAKELISLHKAAKKDVVDFTKLIADKTVEINTATGLNHQTEPITSLKRRTYDDAVVVLASLTETKTRAVADEASYATLLTNAGINPSTYKPLAGSLQP